MKERRRQPAPPSPKIKRVDRVEKRARVGVGEKKDENKQAPPRRRITVAS